MESFVNTSKILVFSDEPRGRVFVGELDRTKGGYSFVYDNGYLARSTATPLGPDLPLSLKPIKSKKFFESLFDLLPDRNNPAYEEYCRSVGITSDEQDPMVLITHFGGGPSRFAFEMAPDDTLPTGSQVVKFRNSLGLSQRQLACFLDIPIATLQAMEKDTAEVNVARNLVSIFVENPSALWKIVERRGIYLSPTQLEGVRKFIRESEKSRGELFLQRREKYRELGYLEVFHSIKNSSRTWDQNRLLEAARKSMCRNTGWPIGVVMDREKYRPIFKNDGIEAEIEVPEGSYDEWALRRDGSYYFFRVFEEDSLDKFKKNNFIYFDTRIWRISEILLHCEKLYRELGLSDNDIIAIQITHAGLNGRKLAASNPMRDFSLRERWCEEKSVSWSTEITFRGLKNKLLDNVLSASKELLILFEGWQPDSSAIQGIYEEFMKSRI
ncbi:MAG: HipA N-terminal domain-containing protein [Pseudomonadota bacterium]